MINPMMTPLRRGWSARLLSGFLCVVAGGLAVSTAAGAAVGGEPAAVAEAHRLIDAAIRNQRGIPAYVTVAVKEHGRGTEKTIQTIRNTGAPVQLLRVEKVIELPRLAPKTTVMIQNYEGLWHDYNGVSLRLMFPFRWERPIPPRLSTAQALAARNKIPHEEAKHLRCTWEENIDHFGIPCTRITLSVAPELLPFLTAPSRPPAPAPAGGSGPGERRPGQAPPHDLPASFVYHIARDTPFILSWQSYAVNGAKLSEITYQEFKVLERVPDAAFVLPAGHKIVSVANQDEYFRALQGLRPPPSTKRKR